ncbi:hypothetical protein WJX84_007216 [Apatococcus fuscideae]|uniref:VWFA domain-containing protein n=1 Tax=Apatococcus fuscideae TaxID=2026836 RepID=A0AAW1SPJ8_9CHLO
MSISDLARNGGRDGQQAAPINVSQALESGSSNLALMPHQPASSLKAETLAQPDVHEPLDPFVERKMLDRVEHIMQRVSHLLCNCEEVLKFLTTGLRILQLMKVSRIFLGISSPSVRKYMLADEAKVRECFAGIPSGLLPSPVQQALERLDVMSGPQDNYELPAIERLQGSDAQLQPVGSHFSQNAAPEQKWELENFVTQGTQLVSLEVEQLTNPADLVPELITKYVNKKALEAKKPSQKSGQAAIDTAAAAVDEEHLQRLQATINFDPKASITDLVAAYAQAAASKKASSVVVDTSLPCTEHKDLKGSPSDYQRLAQTELLQNSCRLVLRNFQAFFQQFHDKVQQHQDVEWIIMVDNSGSMKSKRIQVAEAIVIIAETLRRIECRFGVWRFGGKGQAGCRMMKALDQPFDHLVGQQILEGFSYTEGTYPASNLERIAKAVWPEDIPASSSTKQTHRAILMVLDGLTQETVTEDYRGILQQKDINLCPRTMFVMSDGYGISGSRLAQALQLAQEENVMVMGMGIGLDKTYVPSCYQHWLTAGLPSAVPAAFRQLHGQETSSIASPEDSHGSVPDWEQQLLRDQSSKILTSKDIVENMQHIFSHLHAEAQQSNELKVAPGSMPTSIQLHIVFALDCTGSMQPWITAARQQICGITGAIKPKVQKAVPEVQLDLKFALVAFRDYEDVLPGSPSHIHSFGLTDQPDQLQEWLKSDVCSPSGGGDLPEDVLGGLNEAIDLVKGSGDEAIIKFVVLIGDGPAHGPECNSGLPDRFPNGCPGQPSFTVKQVMERMQHEHVDLLMTRIRPEATDVMLAAFRSYYDVKDCRVKVTTVAFGSRADHACLEAMAQTAGGKFKAASTGEDLMRIFEAAAQDCNAVDGLVKRFEETISDMISTKVVLDHM